ncbi:unnamed protein product [Arabidopsis halleri]
MVSLQNLIVETELNINELNVAEIVDSIKEENIYGGVIRS